ncbi:MAG: hypothetical protein ACI4UE_01545 [Candidatus Scatovivens sp.]
MLAKIWKKLLLFICIIAILFNLTSKLVYRTNLVNELKSVIGGSSLSEIFNKKEDTTINSNEIVDKTNKKENSIQVNKVTVVIN